MGLCSSHGYHALTKQYELFEEQVLGEGSYSVVFRGRHRSSQDAVAIKRIEKQRSVAQQLWEDEVALLRQCGQHANIVELRDVFQTTTHVFIVTDLAQGGELFETLVNEGAYSEWDARRFIRDVLYALQFLHQQHIVHRDLKPENLLLTSPDPKTARIKLADFSMAKIVDRKSLLGSDHLTWAYCAPEVLDEKADGVTYDDKCDIWSVGIVLYVLLTGSHPFDYDGRQTKDQMIANIRAGRFDIEGAPVWNDISTEAKDFITRILTIDPSKRPTAAEALEDAWFTSVHTPREPLKVSTSGGLGEYQRKMRRKFRSSVLVAVAAEVFRRSLKKSEHGDDQNPTTAMTCAVAAEEYSHLPTKSVEENQTIANASDDNAPEKPIEEVSSSHQFKPMKSQYALLFGKQTDFRDADQPQPVEGVDSTDVQVAVEDCQGP